MRAIRFGNGDISLILTQGGFSSIRSLAEEKLVASARIQATEGDPLKDKEIQLIYHPTKNVGFRDCGIDCSEMIRHFDSPPIPVYISKETVRTLENREFCGSCYIDAKLIIKVS